MSTMNDQCHDICEALYEQHKATPYISQLDLMKLAFRAARARTQTEFYNQGYTAGASHTASTISAILEGGLLRPKDSLTVRDVSWHGHEEPTDAQLELAEERGARSYADLDCGDTPDPLPDWNTVPDGAPMVPR
jgi:hypothetical protein